MSLRTAVVLSVLIAGGQIAGAAISEPAPQSGSPTRVDGFFGIRQIDGVWWFIGPDGKPFYSIGVNYCGGVSLEFPPGPPGSSAYQEQFAEREPASKLWADRFHRWRINTCASVMGNWNGRFPTTPIYRIVLRARYLKVPEAEQFGFLDVYSPEFTQVCDDWAQWVVEPQAENPLIIGWFIDNEFHLPQDEAFQRQFYGVVVSAIRKYDPNHLILGTRHEHPNRTDLDLRVEGEFCDVLTANYYTLVPDRELLERMHRLSGRPVLIGEFALAAKDSGLPNPRSHAGTLFETQSDRATAYEIYTTHAAEMPFVVGTHYFLVHDRKEILMNNWGLADREGKLYYGFVSRFAEIHEKLPDIHAGELTPKRYPGDYPGFQPAFNDHPRMVDMATLSEIGDWLWQPAVLHYACTPGTGPFFFERESDESWGYKENGFIEYRFHLKSALNDAHLLFRYASYPNSATHTLQVEVNDEEAATLVCAKPEQEATSPPGYAYGYGAMRLATLSVPLNMDIPEGLTNVRFCVKTPWQQRQGIILHGFFLSAGPRTVRPDDYFGLE